jgi:hypothetical protein
MACRSASEPERLALVEATGQAWKLSACHGGLMAAGIAFAVQVLGPREWMMPAFLTVIALGAGLAVVVAVRCPSCRRSLGLWAMTRRTPAGRHESLETVEACPRCGWSEPPASAAGPGMVRPS